MNPALGDAILLFRVTLSHSMKKLLRVFLFCAGLALLAGILLWNLVDDQRGTRWAVSVIRDRFPEVSQLSPESLQTWQQDPTRKPPFLLDARSAEEYELSHLQGAIHLDEKTASEADWAQLDPQASYVVYCSAGYRSCLLAQKLQAQGFAHVQNLEGGLFAWANSGHPLWQGNVPAHTVHPYHPLFSRLLKPELRP